MSPSVIASIVELTNQNIPPRNALTYVDSGAGGFILCLDKIGRRNFIIVNGGPSRYFIRSVVREKVRGKACDWLINGQANKNAVQVGYWQEDLIYKSTFEQLFEWIESNFDMKRFVSDPQRMIDLMSVYGREIPDFRNKLLEKLSKEYLTT